MTTWNVEKGLNGLAENEAKLASYHNTPFTKLCLGMTWNDDTNWILVNYNATSLYSVIADENYHKTNAGRAEWISLINGTELQPYCNKEGFNIKFNVRNLKLRIGIAGNSEDNCDSCDSAIGFGTEIKDAHNRHFLWKLSSGNMHVYVHSLMTFGYIFVQ